jgi:hypothetical protein
LVDCATCENAAGIDDPAALQRERGPDPSKFLEQDLEIEANQVVAAEIAAVEEASQAGGDFVELGLVGDVGIGDAVDSQSLRRDRPSGIDTASAVIWFRPRFQLENADLDDAVVLHVGARRLKNENRDRAVKFKIISHVHSRFDLGRWSLGVSSRRKARGSSLPASRRGASL